LGHVSIAFEGYSFQKKEEEGFCQLLTYIWLTQLEGEGRRHRDLIFPEDDIRHFRNLIEISPNSYGEGFREALEAVELEWSIKDLIEYLHTFGHYPEKKFGEDNDSDFFPEKRGIRGFLFDVLLGSLNFLKANYNLVYGLFSRSRVERAIHALSTPFPEQRRIVVRFHGAKRFFLFNSEEISLLKLKEEIQERLGSMLKGSIITGFICCGIQIRCDKDVQQLRDGDELIVEASAL